MLVARLNDAGASRIVRPNGPRGVRNRLLRQVGCAQRAAAEALEPRLLLALVEWDGGAGTDSWHDALNWSGDAVPTEVDDVVIGESEFASIRVTAFGVTAVRSLTTEVDMVVRSTMSVTDGVVLNARMWIGEGANGGTLLFHTSPEQSLAGHGEVIFAFTGANPNARVRASGTVSLTIGPGILVHGTSGEVQTDGGTLVIEGTISADSAGHTIWVYGGRYGIGSLVNRGRLEAPAGALWAFGEELRLESTGTFSGVGGTFGMGGMLDLTNATLELSAATGDVYFGGAIRGGTITSTDGASLILQGNGGGFTFTDFIGVHVAAPVTVQGAELRVRDGMVLDGTITLGDGGHLFGGTHAGWGKLRFVASALEQVVSGTGDIVLNHHAGPRITDATTSLIVAPDASVVISEGIAIRGGGGDVRVMAGGSLVIEGTVIAELANRAIGLHPIGSTSAFIVRGRLVSSAGLLAIGGLSAVATITVQTGCRVASEGGIVHIRGSVDVTGQILEVEGEITLGGTIIGGEIREAPGAGRLSFASSSQGAYATLRGVHVQVPVDVVNDGTLYIEDGLRLDATLTIGVSSPVSLGHVWFRTTVEQALEGNAEVVFGASSGYSTLAAQGSAVRILAGLNIRGGSGRIMTSGDGSFTHFGDLLAATSGGTISLIGNITHHGTMRIAAGATIARTGAWTFQPGSRLEVEIGGTTNAEIGRFTSTGPIVVGGLMDVRYINGYEPPRGSSFRFVTSAGASGEFSSIITPPLSDPDLKSPVLIDGQGVRLIVTHIADFNNDLSVNEADIVAFLVEWFAGGGDFDGDGERTVSDIFVYLSAWHRA